MQNLRNYEKEDVLNEAKKESEFTGEAESLVKPGTTATMGVVSSLDMELSMWKVPPETENNQPSLVKTAQKILIVLEIAQAELLLLQAVQVAKAYHQSSLANLMQWFHHQKHGRFVCKIKVNMKLS